MLQAWVRPLLGRHERQRVFDGGHTRRLQHATHRSVEPIHAAHGRHREGMSSLKRVLRWVGPMRRLGCNGVRVSRRKLSSASIMPWRRSAALVAILALVLASPQVRRLSLSALRSTRLDDDVRWHVLQCSDTTTCLAPQQPNPPPARRVGKSHPRSARADAVVLVPNAHPHPAYNIVACRILPEALTRARGASPGTSKSLPIAHGISLTRLHPVWTVSGAAMDHISYG